MTTPPPQKPLSPHFPANWQGGVFNHLEPLHEEWFLESWAEPEWVAMMTDWAPLEPLTEGDRPEVWGRLEPGGGGVGPRKTEARSGAVVRMSASGLVLDDYDQWLNVSRYGPPIDLSSVRLNDICLAEIEKGRDGRCYLVSLTVLPLDEPHAGSPPDAKTHGSPGAEHMEPGGDGR